MPFYTFKCPKCKDVKEVLQGMNDEAPTCQECSTILPRRYVKMKRVYRATGKPKFKGNGFYETDYRSDAYKKDAKKAQDSTTGKKKTDAKSKKETNPSSPTPKKD